MTATRIPSRLIRVPAVLAKTGLGRTLMYNAIAAGSFPAPIKIGLRAAAWLESEVDDWIEQRVGERSKKRV